VRGELEARDASNHCARRARFAYADDVIAGPLTPTFVRACRGPDRLLVCFSDVEMGAGGPFDDFPRSDFLAETIRTYSRDPYRWLSIDLVFNGDTFDLLKTSYRGGFPHHVTRDIAIDKMERIAAAHRVFFEQLGEFLRGDPERRRVFFVVGNHDMELFFPEVQTLIRERIGVSDHVYFPGLSLSLGRVRIEHGSQLDTLFAIDPDKPFIDRRDGEKLLNLSWAAVALLDVALPLQPILYHHDRLKPRELVLELIPEAKELLTSEFWHYWTKRYFREVWAGDDPLKTVSWTMLKELVRRMVSWHAEVEMGDDLQRKMIASDEFDLYLVGHQHEPGWWSHGSRKVLRTGCLRDEFMLSDRGAVQTPINKTWAEVYMAGAEVVRSHLVEVPAPERPRGTMPESIFECVAELRARLSSAKTREGEKAAQAAQELRERRG
jgi:UDP-2,3-diacylglucosamine pyrophosphatase LpxH